MEDKKRAVHSRLQIEALRKRAEEILQSRPEVFKRISSTDIKDLVHELQTYEIELEMQNQELDSSRQMIEALKDKYLYLYNFAPCGYVTLDTKGVIEEANLTAAEMLRMDKMLLVGKPFSVFLSSDSQKDFFGHIDSLLAKEKSGACEVMLKRSDKSVFFVQLVSRIFAEQEDVPVRITTMMIDITERKKLEADLKQHINEMEVMFKSTINREDRIIELKDEIKRLNKDSQK